MQRQRAARNTLSRDAIVERAVGVLDEYGADGLTMRSLAHALGAATWEVQLNTGKADAESRRRMQAGLESMSATQYPTLVDLAPELVQQAWGERQFTFGLDLILEGLRRVR